MFNKYLMKTNSNAVCYFESLIKKYLSGEKNIPNSIILWGSDSIAQYMFAIEIARNLNCLQDRSIDCGCLNCSWIKKGEHPEIRTVSKINSKSVNDETKNISVKQIKELLEQISMKSSDYRVIIFCDADFEKLTNSQISHLEKFGELNNVITQNEEKYWIPKPLNSKVFQEESANALLKTLEEPPEKLIFIFLSSSPNDLIPTIISRSQMFYIQNTYTPEYDFSFCKEIFKDFPCTKKEDFYDFSQKSLDYIKTSELALFDYFEIIQAYFTQMFSINYSDNLTKKRILSAIENVIKAKKYSLASIKPEYILDNFWINIS